MVHPRPVAVNEKNAAAMLDINRTEFRRLVSVGALPRPSLIGGRLERWAVSQLEGILTGATMSDEFET